MWLGWLIFSIYLILIVEMAWGLRRIGHLRDIVPVLQEWPDVSIVVAARNEEKNLAEALYSLLALDYPAYEVIVVNDRSEDATAEILARVQREDSRLRVAKVEALPEGWLGKNHALWKGSGMADGELLLFTDADVVMAPSTLRRAVTFLRQRSLDHLAIAPEARMPGALLNSFGLVFGLFFFLFVRPWRASRRGRRAHIGIGAFNLVSREAYRSAGGHARIALRPDDDLKLGKLLKLNGCSQELLFGDRMLHVEWYDSLRALALGLEKNLFAGTDYRLWLVLAGSAAHLAGSVFPFVAWLFLSGMSLLPWVLLALLLLLVTGAGSWQQGLNPAYALLFPLAALLFVALLLRTTLLNLFHGGITWRGTFYPLDILRRNRL